MDEQVVETPVEAPVVSYGLKETKEVVKFAIDLGESFDKALADGKMTFEDAVYFFNALMGAGPAFSDISIVPKELADMDATERAELVRYVEVELDIVNDKVEITIEKALATAMAIYEIILMFRTGVKKA